jgi:fumarate reductase flavoprotein subunit
MARASWQEEADLVVVGGSVGGLAAAVLAADRGARTVVLERTKQLGGGAATEPEHVAAAGTRFQAEAGVADDVASLVDDLVAAAGDAVERDVAAAIGEQGAPLVAWLADRCAVNVELLSGAALPGHSRPRVHTAGDQGGASLAAVLTRAATRHSHVTVRTGVLVEHLVRADAGGVAGVAVRAERRGAPQTVAGRVLLACGGFAGDDGLVVEHCPVVAGLPFRGVVPPTGEGLRLGAEVGAATRRLADCRVTPFLAIPGEYEVGVPLLGMGALLVNQRGTPLDDRGADGQALAELILAQPGRVAYLVFDERTATAARAADPFFARTVLPKTARRATTLKDLAKQLEIDLAGLTAAIEPLGPVLEPTPGGAAPAHGLLPPLHAIRITGARRATLGGLAVDACARVLDGDGRPIPGLYATTAAAATPGGRAVGVIPGVAALSALGLARLAALDVVGSLPPEAA